MQQQLDRSQTTSRDEAQRAETDADERALGSSIVGYLAKELAARRLNLFTGAGFSSDAADARGRPIPTGNELADELWSLCFESEPRDPSSSLGDLFHVALDEAREGLTQLLRDRLSVDPISLPHWYETWFSLPWRRVYTVNVDDLECAASERFHLPRRVVSMSALSPDARCLAHPPPDTLEVVHLNGMLADGPEQVTFSALQYGARLASEDDCYERLGVDLERYPFVFVGTKLDESPLWQHLDGRAIEERPRSFLVTRSVSRARQALLERLNIEWVRQTAAGFAESVLSELPSPDPTYVGNASDSSSL